jgi:hypothetical protein
VLRELLAYEAFVFTSRGNIASRLSWATLLSCIILGFFCAFTIGLVHEDKAHFLKNGCVSSNELQRTLKLPNLDFGPCSRKKILCR